MARSRDLRSEIERMMKDKKKAPEIAKILKIPKRTVNYNLKKLKETGSTNDRSRSGRPNTATSMEIVKRTREKIRRKANRSMRQMAKDEGISERSMRRVVREKLRKRSYKVQKAHGLTDQMKITRLNRCKELLKRFKTSARASTILFTDECLFTVEQFVNHQNDRIIAENIREANKKGRIASRTAHPQALMVFGAITGDGRMPLIFVDPGVKINAQNYLDEILKKEVLPWANSYFGQTNWTYQQDSAPAHKAKVVQAWCKANFPDVISSAEWPPSSPDLNPLDYSVWGIMKTKVGTVRYANLNELRRAIEKAWAELDADVIHAAVKSFPKRLKACIKAKGGIFEI